MNKLVYEDIFDLDRRMDAHEGLARLENMNYDLSIFSMPRIILEAAKKPLNSGVLGYSSLGGITSLREAIASYESTLTGNPDGDEACIFVGNGTTEILYNVIQAILKLPENQQHHRDGFIIPTPNYPLFQTIISHLGAQTQFVPTAREHHFMPTIEEVESAVDGSTCGIIVCNPCNPTSISYPEATLKGIVEIAHKHKLMMLSDEVYSGMYRDGRRHYHLASLNGGYDRLVKVFGPCKDRPGMTAFRIGYCIGDKRLEKNLFREYLSRNFCINLVSQHAFLVDILLRNPSPPEHLKPVVEEHSPELVQEYQLIIQRNLRRIFAYQNVMREALLSSNKIADVVQPDGGNTLFARYGQDMPAEDLFRMLLEEKKVGAYPGTIFHMPESKSWLRICITRHINTIAEGVRRLTGLGSFDVAIQEKIDELAGESGVPPSAKEESHLP